MRGRHRRAWPSWCQRRPPAIPCATRPSPIKFDDARVPGALHFHGGVRQEGRRGRQGVLRPQPPDGRRSRPSAWKRTWKPPRALLSGLGEMHLEVITKKLSSKFGAECVLQDPKIPYRETIRKTHRRARAATRSRPAVTASSATCVIEFCPERRRQRRSATLWTPSWAAWCRATSSPRWKRACAKTCRRACSPGIRWWACTAKLHDGSYHAVDSSEMAFKTAARLAFKKLVDASPVLLEPIYSRGSATCRTSTWAISSAI